MYPIIPYKKYIFQTRRSPEEVARLVSEQISPPRRLFRRAPTPRKEFEGTVSISGFRVNRVTKFRNNFKPYLYGKFSTAAGGTYVEIKMTLHPLVMLFAALWIGAIALILLILFGQMLFQGLKFEPAMLIAPGMLLFFYMVLFIGYGTEAANSERFVAEVFEEV